MALQTTGAISLSQIQTELGGGNPISMTEYYKGGIYTSSSGQGNGSIPTSGALDITDFYGADNTPAVVPEWHYESASTGSGPYGTMSAGGFDYYSRGIAGTGPWSGHGALTGWIKCTAGTFNAVAAGVNAGDTTALINAMSTWAIHSSKAGTNNEVMAPSGAASGTSFNGVPVYAWSVSRTLSIFGGNMYFSATVKKFY